MLSFARHHQNNKGFALTQILLAIALSSIVAIGVVGYYHHVNVQQVANTEADQIVKTTEQSSQASSVGNDTGNNTVLNGLSLSTVNGKTVVTQMNYDKCQLLSSVLREKGTVTASCNSEQPEQNKISFQPKNTVLLASSNGLVNAGTPDIGGVNQTSNPAMSGNVNGTETGQSTDATTTFDSASVTGSSVASVLQNGGIGTVVSGGVTTNSPTGTSSFVGGGTMACGWKLANLNAYKTSSLGTRATPCGANQASTSNQTGTRTWACAVSTSANNPVSTDTWTGGSCAALCKPLASQTQNIGCPTNQVGTQSQKRDSSCPAQTGSPVWSAWYTTGSTCAWNTSCTGYPAGYAWNGSTCAQTCNAKIPSPSIGNETRATPQSDCGAGYVATGDETRSWSYSCASTFAATPVKKYTPWSAGTCSPSTPTSATITNSKVCILNDTSYGKVCGQYGVGAMIDSGYGPNAVATFTVNAGSSSSAQTINCPSNGYPREVILCSGTYNVGGASVTVKTIMNFDTNNEGIGSSTQASYGGYEVTIGGNCKHMPAYPTGGGGTSTTCVW